MPPFKKFFVFMLILTFGFSSAIFAAYTLNLGDILDIKVVGHDDLTSKQSITPDGTISLPLLGRIAVQNKTLSELDSELTIGFSKYIKSPQVTVSLIPKESKSEELPYFVVLHDLKKDTWEVKQAKTSAEAWAWTNGRPFQLLRNGQKIETNQLQLGDSFLVSYSKSPDFFEDNWYKILTAVGLMTGIYLSLSK